MVGETTEPKWPNRRVIVTTPATHSQPATNLATITSEWRDNAKRDHGRILTETTWPHDLVRSCLTCVSWNIKEEKCRRYDARPPAWIIAFGCDNYTDENEVPF